MDIILKKLKVLINEKKVINSIYIFNFSFNNSNNW